MCMPVSYEPVNVTPAVRWMLHERVADRAARRRIR